VSRTPRLILASLAIAGILCGCSHGSKAIPDTSEATPTPSPTPTSGSTSFSQADFTCPTSDSSTSVARSNTGVRVAADATRMAVRGHVRSKTPSSTILEVTYATDTATKNASAITQRETAAGTSLVRTIAFKHIRTTMHVVAVPAGKSLASAEAQLKAQPGVQTVTVQGARRTTSSVTTPYWTNDPYFDGFTTAQNATAGYPATGAFKTLPYAETAGSPGQWDMQAIGLSGAFAYSQPSNGSGITNPNALGSPSIKLAVIDTGEDPTHPELHAKIAYQKCFITNPDNVSSTSDYETDPDGHGTDVSGIAAADTNNSFGFTGAGGNVSLYAYRVFPTPDDDCENNSDAGDNDPQCGASTTDIASAIEDAVSQGVNVISMSLGGDQCTGQSEWGGDSDQAEGDAVEDAIAANVIVIAAAGNDYKEGVEAPGCDAGVLAVGATSLDDGQPNGSTHVGGTAANPIEYVTSYTDYGSPGASLNSTGAWGVVAPGGDPSSDLDGDDLHWIENIWTSTPYQSSSTDGTYAGACYDDWPNENSVTAPVDCRTQIAGTSMATPHVAGAAALILSVNATYQSAAKMRGLLCQTADDIGDPNEGCGRLDIYRAMAVALADPSPPTSSESTAVMRR
jgi:subtilisin family serine protease